MKFEGNPLVKPRDRNKGTLHADLDGSQSFYTEYKQLVIRAYTLPLPLLGVACILNPLGAVYFDRRDKVIVLLTSVAILYLISGLPAANARCIP